MKNYLYWIFYLLCTVFPSGLGAQNLLEQAIALRPYVNREPNGTFVFVQDSVRGPECLALLATATGLDPSDQRIKKILDVLHGNPYLGRRAKVTIPNSYQSMEPVFNINRDRTPPGRSQGIFNVSAVADGLAKFLVTRTKQELSIAFFEDFQKTIRNNVHLSTLYPATAQTLGAIGTQIYQFDNYLNDLRESFDKDMRVLPTNLKTYIINQELFKNPYRQILAEDLLDLSQAIVNKTPADSILQLLATATALQQPGRLLEIADTLTRARMQTLAGGFKVVNLFSESLRCDTSKGIWLGRAGLETALRDSATLYIYLGLLWHSGKEIQLTQNLSFRDVLGGLQTFDNLRGCLRDFSTYGQQVFNGQKAYLQFRADNPTAEADAVPYEPFYTFCNGLFGLLETGTRFKVQVANIVGENTRFDTIFLNTLEHLNDLNYDVHAKLYASAVNDVVLVLDNLLGSDFSFRGPMVKYGRFIANMAEADNSDEVAAAIEAIALPPGSARLKKESKWSVSLNAYVGGSFAQEKLDLTRKKAFTAALSAPVGFAFSKGFGGRQSLSLFAPVIDVGAIAAFRFNDPDAGDLPDLKWANLFSPGAYVVWGFAKKWPIAIGLGAQRGPNLRKINSILMPEIKEDSGWRYGGFISVDIPVFNFFSQ